MKIRTGFVSNSSSSSFVVVFPRKPESTQDVKELLFGNQKFYSDPFSDEQYSTWKIAKIVWEDICLQQKDMLTNKRIEGCFMSGYMDSDPPFPSDNKWEKYNREKEKIRKKLMKKFLKKAENKFVYAFVYGDDDSLGSAMEHGDLFDALEHIKISNR